MRSDGNHSGALMLRLDSISGNACSGHAFGPAARDRIATIARRTAHFTLAVWLGLFLLVSSLTAQIEDWRLVTDRHYLRIPQMKGLVSFYPTGHGHEIEVTYELALDPGGRVPAWIANLMLKDAPYFTLERLRQIVTRPEYQDWQEPVLQLPW